MDIVALVLSTITAAASAIAAILTYINGKKTSYGNLELQIRAMISDAKYHLLEFSYRCADLDKDIASKQIDSLNEELRIIGKWAFYGCNIGNITIPSTVEVIAPGAFINNPLTRVYLYEDCYISYLDDNALREIFGSAMIIRLPKKVMSLKR